EALADARPPLAHRAAHQDRVEGPLAAVARLGEDAGEPDVTHVVLAARVRAAADLDGEGAEPFGEAVARLGVRAEVRVDALGHPHRAGDGERAVVHARAGDDVVDGGDVGLPSSIATSSACSAGSAASGIHWRTRFWSFVVRIVPLPCARVRRATARIWSAVMSPSGTWTTAAR